MCISEVFELMTWMYICVAEYVAVCFAVCVVVCFVARGVVCVAVGVYI